MSADKAEGTGGVVISAAADHHAQAVPDANAGTPFTFTVTRSNGAGTAAVGYEVDFGVDQISKFAKALAAVEGHADQSDFIGSTSGTVQFENGQTSKTVTIFVNPDSVAESDERFTVHLVDPSNGGISTTAGQADGVIRNDDEAAGTVYSFEDASIEHNEGDSGVTTYTYTVLRSGDTSKAASVDFSVAGSGDNPADGADFQGGQLPTGTVHFAAGESAAALVVNVSGDKTFAATEAFTVSLSNPSDAGSVLQTAGTAQGSIINDDQPFDYRFELNGPNFNPEGSGTYQVNEGVEVTNASGAGDQYDFSPEGFSFTAGLAGGFPTDGAIAKVTDIGNGIPNIAGVNLTQNGITGLTASDITYTNDSVSVDLTGTQVQAGATFHVQFVFADVVLM